MIDRRFSVFNREISLSKFSIFSRSASSSCSIFSLSSVDLPNWLDKDWLENSKFAMVSERLCLSASHLTEQEELERSLFLQSWAHTSSPESPTHEFSCLSHDLRGPIECLPGVSSPTGAVLLTPTPAVPCAEFAVRPLAALAFGRIRTLFARSGSWTSSSPSLLLGERVHSAAKGSISKK